MSTQKWVTIGVSILLLFSLMAAFIPSMTNAGDELDSYGTELTVQARCEEVGCFWNATRTNDCSKTNVSKGDSTTCANTYPELPLGSMFGSSGITFILVSIFIIVAVMALVMSKKH